MENVFSGAKWIWAQDNTRRGDVVIFRKPFKTEKVPKSAIARAAAAEGTYSLYIGTDAVAVGAGVNGTYDVIELGKYISKGDNVLTVTAHFPACAGKNTRGAGSAGFIFECEELGLYSDESFTVFRNTAFVSMSDPEPSGLVSGSNIKYDATRESMLTGYQKTEFTSNIFENAVVVGEYGMSFCDGLEENPLPLPTRDFVPKVRRTDKQTNVFAGDRYADVYTVPLPRAMHVYPCFSVSGNSGDRIEIKTDRYYSDGCYADEGQKYNGFCVEYICKAESQQFESIQPLFGEKLVFRIPPTVKVSSLGYAQTRFGADKVGGFDTGGADAALDRLAEKCETVLECCMRDTFIDTPERGAAMRPAAASYGAACALYLYEDASLAEKTMTDMLSAASDDDVFYANPSGEKKELPAEALIALGQYGIAAHYFAHRSDDSLKSRFALAALKYLAKWDLESDGLVKPRAEKCDELFNCDGRLVETLLYLSALKNTRALLKEVGETDEIDFLTDRIDTVSAAAENLYDGCGFSSVKGVYDDRANALAVLAGVTDDGMHESLAKVLTCVQSASMSYEAFVLEALCRIGRSDLAYERMLSRYRGMIASDNSALCEDFVCGGARCHLSSVYPLYIALRYFAGVEITHGGTEITVTPDMRKIDAVNFSCPTADGLLGGRFCRKNGRTEIIVENPSKKEITLVLKAELLGAELTGSDARIVKLGRGKSKFTL